MVFVCFSTEANLRIFYYNIENAPDVVFSLIPNFNLNNQLALNTLGPR